MLVLSTLLLTSREMSFTVVTSRSGNNFLLTYFFKLMDLEFFIPYFIINNSILFNAQTILNLPFGKIVFSSVSF
jgi:hypothetical protein